MGSDQVRCRCGGKLILKNDELICEVCGKKSPYQPMPSCEQLVLENNRLKKRLADLEEKLAKWHETNQDGQEAP